MGSDGEEVSASSIPFGRLDSKRPRVRPALLTGRNHSGLSGNLADMLPNGPVTRAVSLGPEKLELRTVWMDVVRTVRSVMRGGESRRRVPSGKRAAEQPPAWVCTGATRPSGRRARGP